MPPWSAHRRAVAQEPWGRVAIFLVQIGPPEGKTFKNDPAPLTPRPSQSGYWQQCIPGSRLDQAPAPAPADT